MNITCYNQIRWSNVYKYDENGEKNLYQKTNIGIEYLTDADKERTRNRNRS